MSPKQWLWALHLVFNSIQTALLVSMGCDTWASTVKAAAVPWVESLPIAAPPHSPRAGGRLAVLLALGALGPERYGQMQAGPEILAGFDRHGRGWGVGEGENACLFFVCLYKSKSNLKVCVWGGKFGGVCELTGISCQIDRIFPTATLK